MAQATFSVRMDENLKNQFEYLCDMFGMNMSTAINVFARAVVRERRIPFEIAEGKSNNTTDKAMLAMKRMREKAAKDGISDMSLDEINAEIEKTRKGE